MPEFHTATSTISENGEGELVFSIPAGLMEVETLLLGAPLRPTDIDWRNPRNLADYLINKDLQKPGDHFDLDLLRHHILWARKSFELAKNSVETEFDVSWNQTHWLDTAEAVVKQTEPIEGTEWEKAVVIEGFCGTSGCIAGSVAIERGKPIWMRAKGDEGGWTASYVENKEGTTTDIATFAMKELGLTSMEADWLFEAENEIEDLECYAEAFCLRRGLVW